MKTPGVYMVGKDALLNSVLAVPTEISAFIGYTEKADKRGISLLNKPARIASPAVFRNYFGGAPVIAFNGHPGVNFLTPLTDKPIIDGSIAANFMVLLGLPRGIAGSRIASVRQTMNSVASVKEVVGAASGHLGNKDDVSALKLLEKAAQDAPDAPALRYLLGLAQFRQNLHGSAIANLEHAVRLDENNVDFLLSLGEALMKHRPLDAVKHMARAIQLGSKNPQAYSKLADLLIDVQNPDDALCICDLGLNVCGPNPAILWSRGNVLRALARYPESIDCLRQAEVALPESHELMIDLAGSLLSLGRLAESRQYLERVCELKPNSAEAHFNLGLTLLLAGDLRNGFREYEGRWGVRQVATRALDFRQPLWDGSALEGRRILLHAEQGAGDVIQFVRYISFVRERGGRVILLARPPLHRLLSWLPDCEVATDDILPPFDVHCPLLSLPRLAETEIETIPPPAQFAIPPQMKLKWNGILGEKTGTRVGIVWAGAPAHRNDRNRSFACKLFAPLLEIPGTQWFSLQVGAAALQLSEPGIHGHRNKIRDLAPELSDYAETAAAISQLDLVITADTSVAHLAGSLEIPVWMLTPFAPDWRWMLERNDSPWYPDMTLFRQHVAGDWETVMQKVATALRQFEPAKASKQCLVTALPPPSNSGWGTASRRIVEELKKLAVVRDLQESEDGAVLKRDFPVDFNLPVIEGIRGVDLLPLFAQVRGRKNIGYCFVEKNLLLRKYGANAKRWWDVIVTGSAWAKNEMLQAIQSVPGADTRVAVAIQGVDADVFCPSPAILSDPNWFTIYSGGKWEFRKGQDVVIRAVAVMMQRHKDVRLVAAWSNAWAHSAETMRASRLITVARSGLGTMADIRQTAIHNGIPNDRIEFIDPKDHGLSAFDMNKCDVALFPNRCEAGTNLVLMEAMSCGLPVVATISHGHADVTGHLGKPFGIGSKLFSVHENGMPVAEWYEPDLDETIEALEYARSSRESLADHSQRNREAMAQFTWQACAQSLLEACAL